MVRTSIDVIFTATVLACGAASAVFTASLLLSGSWPEGFGYRTDAVAARHAQPDASSCLHGQPDSRCRLAKR